MNGLQIFNNEEFGVVRTVTIDNEPWFVGKDVAKALGYSNASKAVSVHVNEEDRILRTLEADSQNGNVVKTQTALINESGLYALIFGSKLESAKRFKHWVTSEVLPSIRKHGVYAVDELLDNPDMAIKAFTALKEEREKNRLLRADNERMKPHAVLGRAITTANTSILVGDLAKILRQNGIEVGGKRLFEWLRENGYLINGKELTGIFRHNAAWRWGYLKSRNPYTLTGTDVIGLHAHLKSPEKVRSILLTSSLRE